MRQKAEEERNAVEGRLVGCPPAQSCAANSGAARAARENAHGGSTSEVRNMRAFRLSMSASSSLMVHPPKRISCPPAGYNVCMAMSVIASLARHAVAFHASLSMRAEVQVAPEGER